MGAFARHVVAVQRRQRHEFDIQIARQLLGKGQVILFELLKHRFLVVHQIHFVHRHHQMANAQQGCDKTVATSLVQHPFARVDQQDRQIAGGGAGGHVAGVLLMPWGIGDDKFAFSVEK